MCIEEDLSGSPGESVSFFLCSDKPKGEEQRSFLGIHPGRGSAA
jgi:hypothetical protein